MSIQTFFQEQNITLVSAVSFSEAIILKPHLLPDFTPASVIVMAVPYRTNAYRSDLSCYAVAKDYHGFFSSLFARFNEAMLPLYPAHCFKGFADHSPFDERQLALVAGLGVRGDNGLLITKTYGSYVFLGEILTDLSLSELRTAGIPTVEHASAPGECLHCGACAAVCPGKCLPGTVRTTCASALSQKKGALSESEVSVLSASGCLWGCDRCQAVCPMNQNVSATPLPFFAEDRLDNLSLTEITRLPEATYQQYPFAWRPRAILERNLQILNNTTPKGGTNDETGSSD